MKMRAYVLIKTRIGEVLEVVHSLRDLEGVVSADMTLGSYDAIALLEGRTICDIGEIVAHTVQCTPGVVETVTCPICQKL
jgi:DNA-binding Lrp family transcriptional regulator